MHHHSSGCGLLTYFLFFLYKLFGIPILPLLKLKIVKDILGILRTTCLSLHDFFSDVKQCNFSKKTLSFYGHSVPVRSQCRPSQPARGHTGSLWYTWDRGHTGSLWYTWIKKKQLIVA